MLSNISERRDDPFDNEIEPVQCTAGAVPLSLCYVTATLSSRKSPPILERNIRYYQFLTCKHFSRTDY